MRLRRERTVCFGAETSTNSACRYFRGEIPARALRPLRWRATVAPYVLVPTTDEFLKHYGPWIRGWDGKTITNEPAPPASIVTLRLMDDVVMDLESDQPANYTMGNLAPDIERAREAGQIVLYDIDDDIWNIPEWSPASKAMHAKVPELRATDLEVVNANIAACDGVVTPTQYLADEIRSRFSGVAVYLLPPGIDMHDYDVDDAPRLGWMGSKMYEGKPSTALQVGWMGAISHHLQHLRSMQPALDVLPKYGAEFTRLGWIPGDRSELLMAEVPCKVNQLPWGGVDKLGPKLRNLNVGIVPRVQERFHEGQSVTSGLQYAAAGVPFLASPTAEYVRLEHLGAGKTCRGVPDWRQALAALLEFSDYRKTEAERARECVAVEFGLEATGKRYASLFEELLSGN